MANYNQKAIEGYYGRSEESRARESGENHFYFGGNYASIICFKKVVEDSNIQLKNINFTFQRDGSEFSTSVKIYMAKEELTKDDVWRDIVPKEKYILLAENVSLDFKKSNSFTFSLPVSDMSVFNGKHNYWFKIVPQETGNKITRIDGFAQPLAPILSFEYSYGLITGSLPKTIYNLGETISINVNNPNQSMLSATYKWYLNLENKSEGANSFFELSKTSYIGLFSGKTQIEGKVEIYTDPGNSLSSTLNFKVNLPEEKYKPEITLSNYPESGVQLRSNLGFKYETSAVGEGASIESITFQLLYGNENLQIKKIENTSGEYNFPASLFRYSGTYTVICTAMDSRGINNSSSFSVNYASYTPLTYSNFSIYRAKENNEEDLISGTNLGFSIDITKNSSKKIGIDFHKAGEKDYFYSFQQKFSEEEDKKNFSGLILTKEGPSFELLTDSGIQLDVKIYEFYNSDWILLYTETFKIGTANYILHFRPSTSKIGSLGIGAAALEEEKTLNIGWKTFLNGGLGEPLTEENGGTGVKSLDSLATDLASKSAFTQKYIQNSNPILNGMIINSADGLETYDLNFQNPSDYIYQANLDVYQNNFRIKSYNTSTKGEKEPVWVNLETGETWLSSLRLDSPNIVLQNGTLLTYSFSEPTVVVGGLWLKPI